MFHPSNIFYYIIRYIIYNSYTDYHKYRYKRYSTMITTEHCGLDEPYIIILNRYNSIDFHRNGYRYPPSTIQYVILLYANAEPNNYCRSFSCTRRCECDIRKSSRFGAWEWQFFSDVSFLRVIIILSSS